DHWHMVQITSITHIVGILIGKDALFRPNGGFQRDLIIETATVFRAIEPSQIRFLHFLAISQVREFVAERADGQLSLANAARSFQD
ncbi:MAG: hypothetical protein ACKPKO_41415, partial [Candidatus Fonsibacter sp.]